MGCVLGARTVIRQPVPRTRSTGSYPCSTASGPPLVSLFVLFRSVAGLVQASGLQRVSVEGREGHGVS